MGDAALGEHPLAALDGGDDGLGVSRVSLLLADLRRTLTVLPIGDIRAAAEWYEKLLGGPADARPMPSPAEWTVTDTSTLQVFDDPANAGRACVNLEVDSAGAAEAELRRRAVTPRDVVGASALVRILPVVDPDGNTVNLLQTR